MKKILFCGMTGDLLCVKHVLLNALSLKKRGHDVQVVFEGESVRLLPKLYHENNPLYFEAQELGLLSGVCLTCARSLGVYEALLPLGLPFLEELMGHFDMAPSLEAGYEVIVL
ncbi:hypothetical protein ABB02_00492 [Clostridiaceae bacterium JG1575]|nr:hypothetical protein ABB02_00492 [Clostridiaceae bacterium JG1575]